MTPRLPLPPRQATADSRANVLQGLLIAAIVIGGLYFAQEVLLPLAVAILLSFVLTPPMLFLQRIKVPRVLAVVVVVAVVAGAAVVLFVLLLMLVSFYPGRPTVRPPAPTRARKPGRRPRRKPRRDMGH